jgi:Fe2+ transport system protein FeoA
MGIFLGEKIKITNEISNAIIVKVKGKKIALGREIAKGIMVLRYERL